MNAITFIAQGLRHYWRTHLGVAAGAAVATAVLVGGLAVGQSVDVSLRQASLRRVGAIDAAMRRGDSTFRAELAGELSRELDCSAAAVLTVTGVAETQDGSARAIGVQVLGVDERFWPLASQEGSHPPEGWAGAAAAGPDQAAEPSVLINRRLAGQLGLSGGGRMRLVLRRFSELPVEAPLADSARSLAPTVSVASLAADDRGGRFALQASQVEPYNAFVPRAWLERMLGLEGRANLLLAGRPGSQAGGVQVAQADAALAKLWRPADAQLTVEKLPDGRTEIRSGRVFIDPVVERAAAQQGGFEGMLTYFVNEIRLGDRATPYSFVGSAGDLDPPATSPAQTQTQPSTMPVRINSWLADDLDAHEGDVLKVSYFALGPHGELTEARADMKVAAKPAAMEQWPADASWMPEFPGLAGAQHCNDWKPGVQIDLKRIRPKDEKYWDEHGGTPKAVVDLADARRLWGTRFGSLTALRTADPEAAGRLFASLRPRELGLFFVPVRAPALAAKPQTDFSSLFLGLSVFLIVAAVLLMALLAALGAAHRKHEIGMLKALGLPRGRIRSIVLGEASVPVVVGAIVGVPAGLGYTRLMIAALKTVWAAAAWGASDFDLRLRVSGLTVAAGLVCGAAVCAGALWLVLRGMLRRGARELLELAPPEMTARRHRRVASMISWGLLAAGALLVLLPGVLLVGEVRIWTSFAGGVVMLVAFVLGMWSISPGRPDRIKGLTLGVLSAARIGPKTATVATLACATFLLVAVDRNRLEVPRNPYENLPGTGGFALVAQTAQPLAAGEKRGGTGAAAAAMLTGRRSRDFGSTSSVPIRVHAGDTASCLNLNRAAAPPLWGIDPKAMSTETFDFAGVAEGAPVKLGNWPFVSPDKSPWLLLDWEPAPGVISGIADENTLMWSLGKAVGDELTFIDAAGQPFRVRLVASVRNSILQGGVLISAANVERKYPGAGYSMFLIDAVPAEAPEVAARLTRELGDDGIEVVGAAQRLGEFNAVQNAYISIFSVLGALAMALGGLGVGLLVMRNVMEQRWQLAIMRAVGFGRRRLVWSLVSSHTLLVIVALWGGTVSGWLATMRFDSRPMARLDPLLPAALGVIVVSAMLWTYLAARWAVRGDLMQALRSE